MHTIKEVADLLGVSYEHARTQVKRGLIKGMRFGKRGVMIDQKEYDRLSKLGKKTVEVINWRG